MKYIANFTPHMSIIYIILKKIILPVVLLIFSHEELYGMKNGGNQIHNEKEKESELQQKNKWWEFLEPNFKKGQCLRYHIRALFNNFFRKWCGVYKRVELGYGEFFYGTVTGIGWYPQFLNFHDHFRMGFFELSYNSVTTVFRIIRHFLTKRKHDFSLENIVIHFLGGFNLSIINFKIYNNLIRLNFINILVLSIIWFEYKDGYNFYNKERDHEKREYSDILFFGKDLPKLQDFFECEKYGIKHFLLILNLILPEIYFDIDIFNSLNKGQE